MNSTACANDLRMRHIERDGLGTVNSNLLSCVIYFCHYQSNVEKFSVGRLFQFISKQIQSEHKVNECVKMTFSTAQVESVSNSNPTQAKRIILKSRGRAHISFGTVRLVQQSLGHPDCWGGGGAGLPGIQTQPEETPMV
jgi:hypothetical protein